VTLANRAVELDVTVDGGPRVLRYAPVGGRNAFYVVTGPEGPGFRLRGGHRLWVAPEDPARTLVPDDEPVGHALTATTLRATAPPDPRFGLEKQLELTLPGASTVRAQAGAGPPPSRRATGPRSRSSTGSRTGVTPRRSSPPGP